MAILEEHLLHAEQMALQAAAPQHETTVEAIHEPAHVNVGMPKNGIENAAPIVELCEMQNKCCVFVAFVFLSMFFGGIICFKFELEK